MGKAIGIDLGTTLSVVAVRRGASQDNTRLREANRTVGLAISKNGERLDGEIAKRQRL
jgi:molecular chaperone DnaK (HSP70)